MCVYCFICIKLDVHLRSYTKKIPVDLKHSTGTPGKLMWLTNVGRGIHSIYCTIPKEERMNVCNKIIQRSLMNQYGNYYYSTKQIKTYTE